MVVFIYRFVTVVFLAFNLLEHYFYFQGSQENFIFSFYWTLWTQFVCIGDHTDDALF